MPRHLISDAHDLNGELSAEFGLAQAISRRSAVCAPLHPYFEYLSFIIQMREFTLALGLAARINTKRDNGKWDAWTGGSKVVQIEARDKRKRLPMIPVAPAMPKQTAGRRSRWLILKKMLCRCVFFVNKY